MQKSELTQFIKAEAKSLGFLVCGIAKADSVNEPTSAYLAQWVGEGRNGTMGYLQRNSDKRTDPRLLVPGCRSIEHGSTAICKTNANKYERRN